MPRSSNIRYLKHDEIDKEKWNKCITHAQNGLIYSYSFYLDQMAKHWDAIVLSDYEAVMPLTWNKKFGIYYLYQPAFTACLGVFGNNLSESLTEEFIQSIPSKFGLIEISLNHGNMLGQQNAVFRRATNYVLPLNKHYDELYGDFRENHQRNIQRSKQAGNVARKDISIGEVVRLNREQMKKVSPVSDEDYERFQKLYELLSSQHKATSYGIMSAQDTLLSSCVFFFSHNRAYYILVGNHPDGRNAGSSHALLDAFIKDHAGQNLILDFEGSDIESLALFYAGFGASKEIYP
ncbi:MAG TPA: hypothetical protein VFP87_06385, partial [Chitinophagaceae bacterium]|nr:hypothetical protein [Chitinophagaceae bacterium]